MRKQLFTLLAAFMALLGISLVTMGVAKANDSASSRVFNQSAYTITVGFSFDAGTYYTPTTLNISPGSWQGEGNGNKAYEPRNLHIKSKWCMDWHFQVWGHAAGPTNTTCAPSAQYPGVRIENIYFGDGNTQNYDVWVTRYWGP